MPSATPSRFSFGLPLLRARPLDAIGRQRVEALLYAGREEAAVNAYRDATHASYAAAVRAVRRMRAALDAKA
jgi:hypothetical protein